MRRSSDYTDRPALDWVLLALLIASLAGNLYQAYRRDDVTPLSANPNSVAVGAQLEYLDVAGESGRRESVELRSSALPTVLFVYSDSCAWCRRTLPAFAALARERSSEYRFVALCIGMQSLVVDAPVATYTAPAKATAEMLKATTVPQTLLIGKDGKVLQVWVGAYVKATRRSVEEYFRLRLPEAPNEELRSRAH